MAQISTIFLDYKTHPPIWEENGGAFYSPNVAYLAQGGGGSTGGTGSQEAGAGLPLQKWGDAAGPGLGGGGVPVVGSKGGRSAVPAAA